MEATGVADVLIEEQAVAEFFQVLPVPHQIALFPGETTRFSAFLYDQRGRDVVGAPLTWQVVDHRVGTITNRGVFRAGFTTGTFPNSILVTANTPPGSQLGFVRAEASVTIIEPRDRLVPASIRALPEPVVLQPGESLQIVSLVVDVNGAIIAGVELQWTMIRPEAGTISERGLFTAGEVKGTYSDAILISVLPEEGVELAPVITTMDVQIVDPTETADQITTMILPQAISLKPEEVQFSVLALDRLGTPLTVYDILWEVAEPVAGAITQDGHFIASDEVGLYPGVAEVSLRIPTLGDEVSFSQTASVAIVEAPVFIEEPGEMRRVVVFPGRVVLASGQSERVSVVSLDSRGLRQRDVTVRWSLAGEVGRITQVGNVIAGDTPGNYPGAIRAEVIQETEDGTLIHTVTASLVILGPLERVDITPQVPLMAPDGRVQFRAVGYDINGHPLPDVNFRWSVTVDVAGTISLNGLFSASKAPGSYPSAVMVRAIQRLTR